MTSIQTESTNAPATATTTTNTPAPMTAEFYNLTVELGKAVEKYGKEYMEEMIKLYDGNVRTAIKAAELFERCHKALRH